MNCKKHKRYRLPYYDYSDEGRYFITICLEDRKRYFGKIINEQIILSQPGKIADEIWNEIPHKFDNVKLDVFQIMPDHFHGIIIFEPGKDSITKLGKNIINDVPTKSGIRNNPMELQTKSLGRIIRWFKGRVKFEISKIKPEFKWQPRFYDRIIRDDKEFYFIREYIINNSKNWNTDILQKYFDDNVLNAENSK